MATREPGTLGSIFNVFPLILISVFIYNIWAFGSTAAHANDPNIVRCHLMDGSVPASLCAQAEPMFKLHMASGAEWDLSFGAVLVLLTLGLLFIELVKATSTVSSTIFNHALSMLVFIISLVEFLLVPAFATSTFFFIMFMSLLDVLAGVVVTIVAARRDVAFEGQQ